MKIRVVSDDKEEINQIATWVYNEWGIEKPENSIDKFAKLIAARSNSRSVPLTLVATDTKILGTVSLVQNEYKPRPELTPFLGSLYVPPEHRQKGIGEALCKRLFEEAKRLEFKKCYLITDKKKDYYTKRGWATILEYSYRNAPAFLMETSL